MAEPQRYASYHIPAWLGCNNTCRGTSNHRVEPPSQLTLIALSSYPIGNVTLTLTLTLTLFDM